MHDHDHDHDHDHTHDHDHSHDHDHDHSHTHDHDHSHEEGPGAEPVLVAGQEARARAVEAALVERKVLTVALIDELLVDLAVPSDLDDDDGWAAPPRDDGQLAFTAGWQPRLVAITLGLCDAGRVRWEIFRQTLVVAIALHEADLDYWGCWQRALEKLLRDLDIVPTAELAARARS